MICKKCGGLLIPKKVKNKTIMMSPSCTEAKKGTACKHANKEEASAVFVDKVEKREEMVVVDADQDYDALPETEETCPKCGHTKAKYWVVQTRAGDEAPTKFIKCQKCAHTWRDYS